jgi:putative hemolysin
MMDDPGRTTPSDRGQVPPKRGHDESAGVAVSNSRSCVEKGYDLHLTKDAPLA